MTSVDINFQNMKENSLPTATEPPGLVQAFLELDKGSTCSDDEFLDFQFRIADANASLQEREATEHMADWRASFASLQEARSLVREGEVESELRELPLKQAHEVAEFALARRREDELRIERQAKEIVELRRTLEVATLEAEKVKSNCALITEEKLNLEEELARQVRICDSFRENAAEFSEAQERVFDENMELKRSLDEAAVTTGRLKVALEEKAAELVAWLGQEGVPPQVSSTLASEDELSLTAEEKEAYSVEAVGTHRSEDSQNLESLISEQDFFEAITADDTSKEEEHLLTSATEKMIISSEAESDDMKHEVLVGNPESSESRGDIEYLTLSPKENLGIQLGRGGRELDVHSKEKEVVVNLRHKIEELQLELERLQPRDSVLDEQQSVKNPNQWEVKKSLTQILVSDESVGKLSDSSSTSKCPEVKVGKEPALNVSSSDGSCTDAEMAGDKLSGEVELDSSTLDAGAVLSVASEAAQSEMAEIQFSESFAALGHSESRSDLEDKFVCVSRNQPWSEVDISNLVETITEELTKLLRVVTKPPSTFSQSTFKHLEARIKSWSNVTTKALQSKVSTPGALDQWKDMVVDLVGQSRQELVSAKQRLSDCESELALMDKLQAECLVASQNISILTDEIHRLEEQSFSDQIEREEEVNVLKEELEQAKQQIVEAHTRAAEQQQVAVSLKEQIQKCESELENSKLGWAEQEFIDSCLGGGREEPDTEDRAVSREEIGRMERILVNLMNRLEENERELGELLIISGGDRDAIVSAKIRRLEQKLEDAKASEEVLAADRANLVRQVDLLKVRVAEVEHELRVENEQHVEMLIQYEEEQGHLEASTRSEAGIVGAKLSEMEHLLAEKTKQLDLAQGGQEPSDSQTKLLTLRARVLTLESNLAVTRQRAVSCEGAIKSQINKEKEKYSKLESAYVLVQSHFATLKTELSEAEQRERRAQSNIESLMVELGIAKDEVFRYEVRLQKTIRQAKEDVEAEKRKHEEIVNSQKQMEWHLCRQLELTEGLEREKAKLREALVDFELQNLALQKERDNLRCAYVQLVRQSDRRAG